MEGANDNYTGLRADGRGAGVGKIGGGVNEPSEIVLGLCSDCGVWRCPHR